MARTSVLAVLALCAACTQAFLAAPARQIQRGTVFRAVADDMKSAEEEALRLTKEFGAKSTEAINAWETYEELASADNSAASRPSLDEACEV